MADGQSKWNGSDPSYIFGLCAQTWTHFHGTSTTVSNKRVSRYLQCDQICQFNHFSVQGKNVASNEWKKTISLPIYYVEKGIFSCNVTVSIVERVPI